MIPCQKCLFVNPMGTRWCRQCGEKLDLNATQVEAFISATQAAAAEDRLSGWGGSVFSAGLFILISTSVVRMALVPALPPADIPLQLPMRVIPMLERNLTSDAAMGIGNTPINSPRLRWRASTCRPVAQALGLELTALDETRQRVAKSQKEDGSFAGSDPLAATGLAVLGLQAWPSDAALAAAAKGRVWLKSQLLDATRRQPLGRTLAMVALDDAQDLSASERGRLLAYLIDGQVPCWQAWQISAIAVSDHPRELGLIRDALVAEKVSGLWLQAMDLRVAKRTDIDAKIFFSESAAKLAPDERLPWTFLAWQLAIAPRDLSQVLKGWSGEPVPAVSEELQKAAGTTAADAVWLMTLAAPMRLPPWPAAIAPR
jgi:hypothetical protein